MADTEKERLDHIEYEITEARRKAMDDHLIPDGKHHGGMFGDEDEGGSEAPTPA
jgi:hypothetical protein